MARKQKSISIYEKIENVQSEILSTEQHLAQLKSELENLLAEKDELEMKQLWQTLKESKLTFEDVQKMLEEKRTTQ